MLLRALATIRTGAPFSPLVFMESPINVARW
jgi:hypothetical protein